MMSWIPTQVLVVCHRKHVVLVFPAAAAVFVCSFSLRYFRPCFPVPSNHMTSTYTFS